MLKEDTAATTSYAVNWDTADERVQECKEFLLNAPQVMDPERLQFLHEVYAENPGESTLLIRARLLERVLAKKTIFLDGNPLVGTLTGVRAGVYAYPEWNVSWIKDEMRLAKMSSLGEMKIADETQDLLKQTYTEWRGRTCIDMNNRMYKDIYGDNPTKYGKSGLWYDHVSITSGSGMVDYPKVLKQGIRALVDDVRDRLRTMPTTVGNKEKVDFYRSVIISLEAVVKYANRYADLCEATAAEESDSKVKAELLEIAEVCRRVPEYPARNFREAIQSFWMVHICLEIEQMACANTPGRYGQYMYPYYRKDIDEGRITKEQVMQLLKFQWIRHLELAEYQGNAYAMALSGHTGQTITLGGLTADGEDACTELEEVILEVQTQMRNPQPTLTLLYHPKIKDSYMKKVVECIKVGGGQPQILNNNIVIQRMLARFAPYEGGITLQDARNCGNIGCVTTGIAGKGSYLYQENHPSLPKLIELILNNGQDPITKYQIGAETGCPSKWETFEDVYDAYKEQLKHLFKISMRHSDLGNMARLQVVPSIFRSAMYDGCIEKGICEEAGGVTYPQSLCITTGGVDAANSLLVIKHLVFDTKKISMHQLIEALETNFVGHEDIQKMCFEAPKHGNDEPETQKFVQQFYRDVDNIHRASGVDFLGREPLIDAYSLSYHNYFGALMGALPTGRKAGKALTDGSVSAMPGTDKEGITALIKSGAEAIDTASYSSNHFNVKFLPSALEGPNGYRTLVSLIKTYCDYGGSHVQFNCVSSETLQEAQDAPQEYRDLTVRVAGFTAYFTRLDKGVQEEIIKRTEYVN
ncbi:formate C-acetyltransferase [Maridesulfovibrio ferrireducens]|uniref:Formate C-acetyltransferase n=1 Tax=Maridesulfovibrio ferrireducens TaxID=246191 RepID=A0A1G9AU49_9BACT|nr:pyruvate formate lyase family protein [Maridesulfovibrio ferrireducens]SDK30424.1 formate C-acetyltransferase [Maridesulfovibrio ferrireducens]